MAQKVKYFDVNLTKSTQDLYADNYEVMIKKNQTIPKYPNKWRNILCSWIGMLNVTLMAILPKLI